MSNAGVRRAKASQIDVFDHFDYGRRVVGGNAIEIQFGRFVPGSINDGRKGIGSDSIAIEYATRRHFIGPPEDSLDTCVEYASESCPRRASNLLPSSQNFLRNCHADSVYVPTQPLDQYKLRSTRQIAPSSVKPQSERSPPLCILPR